MKFEARDIPTLVEGDVELRPVRYRDHAAWAEVRHRNRDWCGPWDPTPPPGSSDQPRDFLTMVRGFRQLARLGETVPWFVWYRDGAADPVLAGQLTVSGIAYGSARWANLGYWVDERWAGRGIIPQAVAMATDYCFDWLRLHRLEIAIRPENAKSLRVVEKLGYRYEGRREKYLHIDGDWRDHDVFVLNAGDFPDGLVAEYRQRRCAARTLPPE
ncbi:GNAT family N-acetyltransferase [Propionicicella superfundia]|uniref:GNAT family N-acetyltransferase n=1 Tax=Propionicicella superfundia TaxID=348582 RepID=UPI000421DC14|nr:GNAT family protein [Propionicicella superfundia]